MLKSAGGAVIGQCGHLIALIRRKREKLKALTKRYALLVAIPWPRAPSNCIVVVIITDIIHKFINSALLLVFYLAIVRFLLKASRGWLSAKGMKIDVMWSAEWRCQRHCHCDERRVTLNPPVTYAPLAIINNTTWIFFLLSRLSLRDAVMRSYEYERKGEFFFFLLFCCSNLFMWVWVLLLVLP